MGIFNVNDTKLFSKQMMRELTAQYVYASTPSFLYDNHRRILKDVVLTSEVRNLLVAEYNHIAAVPLENRTLEMVVVLYATLIAFSFLARDEAYALYAMLLPTYLDWGKEVLDRIENDLKE